MRNFFFFAAAAAFLAVVNGAAGADVIPSNAGTIFNPAPASDGCSKDKDSCSQAPAKETGNALKLPFPPPPEKSARQDPDIPAAGKKASVKGEAAGAEESTPQEDNASILSGEKRKWAAAAAVSVILTLIISRISRNHRRLRPGSKEWGKY